MGQSRMIGSPALGDFYALRETVLHDAAHLSRQDIRDLADDLHQLAREKATIDDLVPRREPLEDDGRPAWI